MLRFAAGTRPALLAFALALLLGAGCRLHDDDPPCSGTFPSVPSFRIDIVVPHGDLPGDLTIHVRTGAGEEVYDLARLCSPDSALVCYRDTVGDLCEGEADGAVAEAGTGSSTKLICNLWTDGTAEVMVTGRGQKGAGHRLVPAQDTCGHIKTSETEIDFDRDD
jgi:hypothetical protein